MRSGGRNFMLAAAAAALLAGCAGDSGRDHQRLPAYQAGYSDGCRTAHNRERGFATKVVRNEEVFDQNAAYRAGWRDGSLSCGTSDGLGRNPFYDDPQIGPNPL